MIATVRYTVTRIEWRSADHVYGVAAGAPERYLGTDLPECLVGDVIEIDYDDAEDERGEVVAARVIER